MLYLSLVVLFTVAFTFLSLSVGLHTLQLYNDKDIESDQGKIYLSIQHESNPLELPNSAQTINGFKEVFNSLNNSSFVYYEIYRQSLDFSFEQDNALYFSETQELVSSSEQVLSVQISENVQKDFKFSLSSGSYLLPEDFNYKKGNTISVLMGSDYSKLYNVGDVFSAYYLYSPFSFKIVGFLDNSCEISLSLGSINLSKYIIMPSINFDDLPQSNTGYVTQKIHYANKTSGKAKTTEDGFDFSYSYIKSTLENSTVGTYSWTSSSIEKNFLVHGFNIKVLFFSCCILSLAFAATALLLAKKYCLTNSFYKSSSHNVSRILLLSTIFISVPLLISLVCSSLLLSLFGLSQVFSIPLLIMAIVLWILFTAILFTSSSRKNN
ncbi:MAG: hypothetical protein WBI14_05110 [Anaerolineaceae bacterium]